MVSPCDGVGNRNLEEMSLCIRPSEFRRGGSLGGRGERGFTELLSPASKDWDLSERTGPVMKSASDKHISGPPAGIGSWVKENSLSL